jgi:hypothetical protein
MWLAQQAVCLSVAHGALHFRERDLRDGEQALQGSCAASGARASGTVIGLSPLQSVIQVGLKLQGTVD